MPPGPLPGKDTRRRNAPTIPTTNLPAGGRKGRAPDPPKAYTLGKAGKEWWAWAWKLPQAAAWDKGALYAIARRAQLEDELAAVSYLADFDLDELIGAADNLERYEALKFVIGHLKGSAAGSIVLKREMREIDDRLGLTPKSLSALRWTIVDDSKDAAAAPTAKSPAKKAGTVHRLRAVDPVAAAG